MKKIPIIPTLTVLFFVILMTSMGFWQIIRAHEKEQIIDLLSNEKSTHITNALELKKLDKYAKISLLGHYINQPQLLLDNQVNNGKQGYHVFTPFKMDSTNAYIMVNRGWIEKSKKVNQLLNVNQQGIDISGKLNSSPKVGIQLGEIALVPQKPIQKITYYEDQKISQFLHESLCQSLDCIISDKIILLNQDQQFGFKRDWKLVIMLPAKHIAYAVQWFAMTAVLILIFIYWLKKQ